MHQIRIGELHVQHGARSVDVGSCVFERWWFHPMWPAMCCACVISQAAMRASGGNRAAASVATLVHQCYSHHDRLTTVGSRRWLESIVIPDPHLQDMQYQQLRDDLNRWLPLIP
jgi:hypothetical protein